MDKDLDPADPTEPVIQQVVAEARETHTQEVSKRAQFAQAASTGLSAASGAAESIIGHTASALRLLPAAAGAARDIIGEEAQFWGPNGPVVGVAAHGVIMAGQVARRNQVEYNGYMAKAWDSATPVRNALKEYLIGKPPSLIADATPQQEMRKALEYQGPEQQEIDWSTPIFSVSSPALRAPPPPKGRPLALMPPSGLDVATSKPKGGIFNQYAGATFKRPPPRGPT